VADLGTLETFTEEPTGVGIGLRRKKALEIYDISDKKYLSLGCKRSLCLVSPEMNIPPNIARYEYGDAVD